MFIIKNPGQVFKSTVPATHKPLAEANEVNYDAAGAKMDALADSLVPGAKAWAYTNDTDALSMTGLSVPAHIDLDVLPAGLRWDSKSKRSDRVLVPAKRTDDGKAIVKQMAALNFNPHLFGSVSKIIRITDGENRWFSAATIEVIGNDVFATYFHPIDTRQMSKTRPCDYDLVAADPGWVEVPLSEFYAAREAATKAEKVNV